jgi:uncharacterized membrane protein
LTTTKQRLPKLDMLMHIPTIWCHFHIATMLHSNKLMHLPTVDTISTTQHYSSWCTCSNCWCQFHIITKTIVFSNPTMRRSKPLGAGQTATPNRAEQLAQMQMQMQVLQLQFKKRPCSITIQCTQCFSRKPYSDCTKWSGNASLTNKDECTV